MTNDNSPGIYTSNTEDSLRNINKTTGKLNQKENTNNTPGIYTSRTEDSLRNINKTTGKLNQKENTNNTPGIYISSTEDSLRNINKTTGKLNQKENTNNTTGIYISNTEDSLRNINETTGKLDQKEDTTTDRINESKIEIIRHQDQNLDIDSDKNQYEGDGKNKSFILVNPQIGPGDIRKENLKGEEGLSLEEMNKSLENWKEILAMYKGLGIDKEDPRIMNIINNIDIVSDRIVNIFNSEKTTPEPPALTPELIPGPVIPTTPEGGESTPEEDAKYRVTKKAKLIAGVIGGVAGVGTAVIGGPVVAGTASLVTTGLLVGSVGVRWVAGRRIRTLEALRDAEPNEVKREQYDKRVGYWRRARQVTKVATTTLKGYAVGLAAGSLFTKFFMGGQGILEKKAAETAANAAKEVAQSNRGKPPGSDMTNNPYQAQPTNTTPTIANEITGINPSETGLIQNGRVNLPGSTWNGNPGGAPTSNLQGLGETLSSNFDGGQFNMAAYHLNKDIASAGLKLTDLTERIGTGGVHRLLNGYLNQIQAGTVNPSLTNVLQSSGLDGASDVLSMIK